MTVFVRPLLYSAEASSASDAGGAGQVDSILFVGPSKEPRARGALARRSAPVQRRSQGQLPFYSDAFFVREISYPKTSAHSASILKEGWLCPLST